jgi:predicted small lipoprotein YifL
MKKTLLLAVISLAITSSLASCGKKEEKFIPSLDTETRCNIRVVGTYDNFEALKE